MYVTKPIFYINLSTIVFFRYYFHMWQFFNHNSLSKIVAQAKYTDTYFVLHISKLLYTTPFWRVFIIHLKTEFLNIPSCIWSYVNKGLMKRAFILTDSSYPKLVNIWKEIMTNTLNDKTIMASVYTFNLLFACVLWYDSICD